MTYAQEVMTQAHALYRANGGGSRDLFSACLSIAHGLVKERRARAGNVQSIMDARRKRKRFSYVLGVAA